MNADYGEKVRNVFEKFETDPEISAVYDQNFERSMVVESDLKLLPDNKLDVSVVEPIYRKPLEILISKVEDIIGILPTGVGQTRFVQRYRLSPTGPFEASLARFSYSKILSKANSKNQALHADFAPAGKRKYLKIIRNN